MSANDIPEWAAIRAAELANEGQSENGPHWVAGDIRFEGEKQFIGHRCLAAFARYIAAHEEAPVDPLLIEAREMFAERHSKGAHDIHWNGAIHKYGAANDVIRAGHLDTHGTLLVILAALRRGAELAKAGEV